MVPQNCIRDQRLRPRGKGDHQLRAGAVNRCRRCVLVDVCAVPVQFSNVRLANCSLDGASPLITVRPSMVTPYAMVSDYSTLRSAWAKDARVSEVCLVQLDGRRHLVNLDVARYNTRHTP